MSPADFLNTSVSFSNPAQRQGSPLAGMLSALAASLEAIGGNAVFQLDPWDDLAAARAWMNLPVLGFGVASRTAVKRRRPGSSRSPVFRVEQLPMGPSSPPARWQILFVADLKQVVLVDVSGPVVLDVLFFRGPQRNLGLLSAEPRVQRVLQQCSSSIILEAANSKCFGMHVGCFEGVCPTLLGNESEWHALLRTWWIVCSR